MDWKTCSQPATFRLSWVFPRVHLTSSRPWHCRMSLKEVKMKIVAGHFSFGRWERKTQMRLSFERGRGDAEKQYFRSERERRGRREWPNTRLYFRHPNISYIVIQIESFVGGWLYLNWKQICGIENSGQRQLTDTWRRKIDESHCNHPLEAKYW